MAIIYTVLNEPQIIELSLSGYCSILPESRFGLKRELPPYVHSRLVISLTSMITKEFPKSNLNLPLEISDLPSSENKMLLLFLLKTSSFKSMKMYFSENDIRLVENAKYVMNNKELKYAITEWKFLRIEVFLEDGAGLIIQNSGLANFIRTSS